MSIIFGVKKFHKYIFGREFSLLTDHKALTTIFGPRKGVPTLADLRLQRWSLILMAYDYDITYRRSEEHGKSDFLSRAPTNVATENLHIHERLANYSKINWLSHDERPSLVTGKGLCDARLAREGRRELGAISQTTR